MGVATANAQARCKAGDDATPTSFTAAFQGAGPGCQIGHRSAALSDRALHDQGDGKRLGQQGMPLSFTNFCPAIQHPEESTYIIDSDDTDSEAKQDYDIAANLGGASPAHVWMRELELNFEGAQSKDYEDIQEHVGQDKQNK